MQRVSDDFAVIASVPHLTGEIRAFDEGQVLAGGVLLALRKDQRAVVQIADQRLDLQPQLFDRP